MAPKARTGPDPAVAWTRLSTLSPADNHARTLDPRLAVLRAHPGWPVTLWFRQRCTRQALPAGLQPGDELIEVNGRDARDGPAFPDLKPEAVYSMVVKRGNDRIEAEMAATAVPAEIPQPVTDGPLRSPAEHGCAKSR